MASFSTTKGCSKCLDKCTYFQHTCMVGFRTTTTFQLSEITIWIELRHGSAQEYDGILFVAEQIKLSLPTVQSSSSFPSSSSAPPPSSPLAISAAASASLLSTVSSSLILPDNSRIYRLWFG